MTRHTSSERLTIQLEQSPSIVVGGGGGGAGGIGEPVVLTDSGMVTVSLAHFVIVKGTSTGVLFPRNAFQAPTMVVVFLRDFVMYRYTLVSRSNGQVGPHCETFSFVF
jgi:hypothetical protein